MTTPDSIAHSTPADCVQQVIEQWAARAADRPALRWGEFSLSYGELNQQANRLARYLQQRGVGPDSLVGLAIERSPAMLIGLLAIWKAGGAYLPLDPKYPADRLGFMLQDATPALVLTSPASRSAIQAALPMAAYCPGLIDLTSDQAKWANLPASNPPPLSAAPAHTLAYVIYTSGSTGRPKGVLVEHGGLANLMRAQQQAFVITPQSRVLQFASLSFDASVFEIVMALCNGASLCLAEPDEVLAGQVLVDLIRRHAVSHATLPPAVLASVPDNTGLDSVQTLILAGEALRPQLARRWRRGRALFNAYGPTEATVCATLYRCNEGSDDTAGVPIGLPLRNTQLLLVDSHGQPVADGDVGEICIGGAGLARGYLKQPALTDQRFVQIGHARFYKTGDLGRRLPDGQLAYLGRNDFQIKLRGFRIEPGEIEARLLEDPAIAEALVLACEVSPGSTVLVAYYLPATGQTAPSPAALQTRLRQQLPESMQPACYQPLAVWPLTANGKLDRAALPLPQLPSRYRAPATPHESLLCQLLAELLQRDPVGADDELLALGMHSLTAVQLATRLREALGRVLPLKTLLGARTVAGLARCLDQPTVTATAPQAQPLPALDTLGNDQRAPLSYQQSAIWLLEQLTPNSLAYNAQSLIRLRGRLDVERLQTALDTIVARHEIFRTTFHAGEGAPYQLVHAEARAVLEHLSLPAGADEAALMALVDQLVARPFTLHQLPLVRWSLIRLGEEEHALLHVEHHFVHDGWSANLFLKELLALYASPSASSEVLPPVPAQYRQYASWQHSPAAQAHYTRLLDYWRDRLHGAPTLLALPTDLPRPALPSYRGRQLRFEFPPALYAQVASFCQREGHTPYSLLLSGFQLLLSRYTGSDDLLIGSAVANRHGRDAEAMLGMFVNSVVLRSRLEDAPSFRTLLARTAETVLDAYDHAELPFEQLVRALQPERSPGYNPLFQVAFSFHSSDLPPLQSDSLSLSLYEAYSNRTAKFDMEIVLLPRSHAGEGLTLLWNYSTDLFLPDTIERMLANYLHLLQQGMQTPERPISQFDATCPTERQRLLYGFNPQPAVAKPPATLAEQFEARVAAAPDAPALSYLAETLSYRQLNERANQLAHRLRAEGVSPDQRVAVCTERSLDLVIGLLAVLKAGGAYVPLDPAYPADRLAFLLRDSAPRLILTHAAARPALDAALADLDTPPPILSLDAAAGQDDHPIANPSPEAVGLTPQHLAYVIYTSGSTGTPKGVMVEHAQVSRLLSATADWFEFGPHDVWTLFHSFAFDFSVWEIWGALLHGGRLVIVPQLTSRSPDDFYQLLCEEGVTVLNQTPTAFRSLITAQAASPLAHRLRTVVFGGEALDAPALRPWYADARNRLCQLVNMYGITETTVHVTYRPLRPTDAEQAGNSLIGQPIPDLQLYLLDRHGQPVPQGAIGELHVGGAGLARGYLNRPELTAQRFITNPFVAGDRLYKTGDLGRYRADGQLEYLGRNDFQVKIRGFRIELGEIEAQLIACPGVREARVVARHDQGDVRLCAYFIAQHPEQPPTAEALRSALAARLPEHMLPSAYVALNHWPLTSHGKLDAAALPAPDSRAISHRPRQVPVGPIETALAAIWSEVLGVAEIGRDDHFFELGGHSLLALRVLEKMRQQGLQADVRALFGTPTLAALAAAVQTAAPPEAVPANRIGDDCHRITPDLLPLVQLTQAEIDHIVATVPGGAASVQDIYPLAPLQEGILFHHRLAGEKDPYLLASLLSFGSRDKLDRYIEALQAVINRHDILRTAFIWEGLREPVQVVWRQARLPVDWLELPADGDRAVQLRQHFDQQHPAGLSLQQAPLMRLLAGQDPQTGQWLALKLFHHIIDDNTSLKQLNAELRAHLANQADQLPLPLPFRNFVARARSGISQAEHSAFFRALLADIDQPTTPFGLTDVLGDGLQMQQARLSVDGELAAGLRRQALALGVSAASLFHTAWALVLGRATGLPCVVFGTVLFGRMQAGEGADRVLGPFINTLPLRVDLGSTAAIACVRQTHQRLTGLIRHEHASLALAQRCSAVAPPTPLFSSVINYRHGALASGAEVRPDPEAGTAHEHVLTQERTNYPLLLSVDDQQDAFDLTVQVTGSVAPARVGQMMRQALSSLLSALDHSPQQAAGTLEVLPPAEREQLHRLNPAPRPYPPSVCLHQLVETQVARTPDAIAVVSASQSLSYAALDAAANRLARHLQQLGVGPDQRVAVCLERSPDMVVALLAVLKAGGAYVPLDPGYPAERLATMLADSAPLAVITHPAARRALDEALAGLPQTPPMVDLVDAAAWAGLADGPLPAGPLQDTHLAYVIYTSGSTGRPKGAMNSHQGVVNRLLWMQEAYALDASDRVLQKTPFSFDVSVWEFFWPLLTGARLVLAEPGGHKDPAYLAGLIASEGITTLHFVPAMLPLFLQLLQQGDHASQCRSLRRVICSGEALAAHVVASLRQQLPQVALHNLYGPTEAAIDVSAWTCPPGKLPAQIPIGTPVANTCLYLLDAQQQLVPWGEPGEIHIGGVQVGRGYLNRPELTAERFIRDPFSPDPAARLYKTGDLGRWLADGNLEYLGRLDFQVKLRGFRIELGEIESALCACAGVAEALVTAQTDGSGETRLIAYYLPAGTAPAQEALLAQLARHLPDYMLPTACVALEAWPLSPNGKVDRKALPAPDLAAAGQLGYVAPRTPIEQAVADIWAEVLQQPRVGIRDNFFQLGGHSLLAARVVSRIQDTLGVDLPLRVLFNTPTIEAVLEYIFAQYESAETSVTAS